MKERVSKQRSHLVVKSNDIIQKTRYSLSMQQQKMLLYMISKIKPTDTISTEYEMEINQFCEVSGMDMNNGYYYTTLKDDLKKMADASIWIRMPDGKERLFRWLNTIEINAGSGKIKYKFHEATEQYLYDLHSRYTKYELINVLAFRSKYSIRLYELLKSYTNVGRVRFSLEEFKRLMDAETYSRFVDLKRKVIEMATGEINELSGDMRVEYAFFKEGRSMAAVEFYIEGVTMIDEIMTSNRRRKILNREVQRNGKSWNDE